MPSATPPTTAGVAALEDELPRQRHLDILLLWQWLLRMEELVVGLTFLLAGFLFSCTNPACPATRWAHGNTSVCTCRARETCNKQLVLNYKQEPQVRCVPVAKRLCCAAVPTEKHKVSCSKKTWLEDESKERSAFEAAECVLCSSADGQSWGQDL